MVGSKLSTNGADLWRVFPTFCGFATALGGGTGVGGSKKGKRVINALDQFQSFLQFPFLAVVHTQHLPLSISTEDWLLEGQAEEWEGALQAFHEHPQFAEGVDPTELKVILMCHRPYCDCVPLHSKNSGKVLEASTASRWFQERQSTYCLAGDFNRRVNLDCW